MARTNKTTPMLAALVACGALGLAAAPAHAQVPGVDFYLGASIGQSNADLDNLPEVSDIDEKDTAWKIVGGVRIASVFGAELNYIDFGSAGIDAVSADYKGLAAYGLFYLPLPLPILDVYAKAGLAKIDLDIDAEDFSADDTKFAYGLGVQLKLGSWAIRGEYERFKISDSGLGAKPSLLSVGFTKSFL